MLAQAVMERLGNLSFRVSPDAFFQSNVPCAELLFDLAGQWADLAPVSLFWPE